MNQIFYEDLECVFLLIMVSDDNIINLFFSFAGQWLAISECESLSEENQKTQRDPDLL